VSPTSPPPPRGRTSSGPHARAPRVLVIEDSRESRELYALELELAGFIVSQAGTGEEGLQQVRRFEPDVIVLDLMLPGLDGFSVARVVRALERYRNVGILAVTALMSEPMRVEALGAGCDFFLRKPVEASTVVEQARLLLDRRHAEPLRS
jgi:DNA-binding response OmpR family regulator